METASGREGVKRQIRRQTFARQNTGFRFIELYKVGGCAPVLLGACAKTLDTFRFYADCDPVGKSFDVSSTDSS